MRRWISSKWSGKQQQLKDLCQRHQLRANDLPDAWIAAQLQVRGLVLVTFDRDFVKLLPAERLQLLSA